MMLDNKVALLSVLCLLTIACNNTLDNTSENNVQAPEIKASFADGETKSSYVYDSTEELGHIYWSVQDKINVFFGTNSYPYTSTNTDSQRNVVFAIDGGIDIPESDALSTNIWGLYPYNAKAICDGSSVITELPDLQYGVPDTFDEETCVTVSHGETVYQQFMNVCSGIKFSLSRDDIKTITLQSNANEALAGKIKVSMPDGTPAINVISGINTIVLRPKTGSTFKKDSYYFIMTLPVAQLTSGFTMTFDSEQQEGKLNYTASTLTLQRSRIAKKNNIDQLASFTDKSSIENVLENIQSITVAPDDDQGNVAVKNLTTSPYMIARFNIDPQSAAQMLAALGTGVIRLKAKYTSAGADSEEFDLTVQNVTFADGEYKVKASAGTLSPEFLFGDTTAAACLVIGNGANEKSSGYFPIKAIVNPGENQGTYDNDWN